MVAVGLHYHFCQGYNTLFHGDIKVTPRKHIQVGESVLHPHALELHRIFSRSDHHTESSVYIGGCAFLQFIKIDRGTNQGIARFHINDLSMQYSYIFPFSLFPVSDTECLQHTSLSSIYVFLFCGGKSGAFLRSCRNQS